MLTPRLKLILGAGAFLLVALILSAWIHDRWSREAGVLTEQIAARDRSIARRDAEIRARDRRLDSLRRADSLKLRARERVLTARADSTARGWDAAKAALEMAGLEMVPMPQVRALEAKADTALADCKALNVGKDDRIANLLAQIKNQDTTRAQTDTTRAASDSTRRDIVTLLRPPWWRRAWGWVEDHAVSVGVGFGLGALARGR